MMKQKNWMKLSFFVCLMLVCCFFLTINISENYSLFKTTMWSKAFTNDSIKPLKRILLWNAYYDDPTHRFGSGIEAFIGHRCPVTNCEATTDRSLLLKSDAVLFHWHSIKADDIPKDRHPKQVWVMLNKEPASRFMKDDHYLDNKINWTMTPRHDSDVVVPYGEFRPIQPSIHNAKPLKSNSRSYQFKNSTAIVSWIVSNCKSPGKRDLYVNELKKHISVDIYGRCGTQKCPTGNVARFCQKFAYNAYKFYLSFENSLCADYVTEKFFSPLKLGSAVPIVYGGADYCRIAPPHSYIDINDFATPQDLANYLIVLDQNDELYQKYRAWKTHFQVVDFKHLCYLCAKLNSESSSDTSKSYQSFSSWYFRENDCVEPPWEKENKNNTFNIREVLGGNFPKFWRNGNKTLSNCNLSCES